MNLELNRPLAFIDIESTGTSPARDRIVEIAVLKLFPDGSETFRVKRANPGIPIPPEATAVHGITDADVAEAPPFAAYARGIYEFLSDCDFAGFGITRFDLPLLRAEFQRARKGIDFSWRDRAVIDAMTIFHERNRRDLSAAVLHYCGRVFPQAHSAEEDVRAALDVLHAQIEKHNDLPRTVDELHRLLNPGMENSIDHEGHFAWEGDVPMVAFGMHKGRPLGEVVDQDRDYWGWVLGGDFSADVKDIVRAALGGQLPTR